MNAAKDKRPRVWTGWAGEFRGEWLRVRVRAESGDLGYAVDRLNGDEWEADRYAPGSPAWAEVVTLAWTSGTVAKAEQDGLRRCHNDKCWARVRPEDCTKRGSRLECSECGQATVWNEDD